MASQQKNSKTAVRATVQSRPNMDGVTPATAATSTTPPAMNLERVQRRSLAPRGLSRVEAARYVGVSPTKFDEMVNDHRMPRPKRIDARRVWDRKRLDDAFEELPDEGADSDDAWTEVTA